MSNPKPPIGSVSWMDLTVPRAEEISRFYEKVAGWTSKRLDMGGYSDYCMDAPQTGETVAGICHARGDNTNLPAQWLIYITVADLEASLQRCITLGGKVVCPAREMGEHGTMAVIQDPAGAVAALFQPKQI